MHDMNNVVQHYLRVKGRASDLYSAPVATYLLRVRDVTGLEIRLTRDC
jgi:hypothetical protein